MARTRPFRERNRKPRCMDRDHLTQCWCSLEPGHKGDHEARGMEGQALASWPKGKR